MPPTATSSGRAGGSSAPDLIERVIGFRKWLVRGDELVSPVADTPWPAPEMTAECRPWWRRTRTGWQLIEPHPEPAPQPGCTCGIYALFEPHGVLQPDSLTAVRGAVAVWGRIEVHGGGMRAEHGRVVALALPPLSRTGRAQARRTAARYGVEAVPTRDLRRVALAHGRPLPAALRLQR